MTRPHFLYSLKHIVVLITEHTGQKDTLYTVQLETKYGLDELLNYSLERIN